MRLSNCCVAGCGLPWQVPNPVESMRTSIAVAALFELAECWIWAGSNSVLEEEPVFSRFHLIQLFPIHATISLK